MSQNFKSDEPTLAKHPSHWARSTVEHQMNTEANMNQFASIIDTHLHGTCEPDPTKRAELLRSVWHVEGELLDPPMSGIGPEQIAQLVAVLSRYPAYQFTRTSDIDTHHDHARYSWNRTARDGIIAVSGLDSATITDNRLSRIIGFFGELAVKQ